MYPIITISREVGSEGHTIGEMVAKELGLPLIDKYSMQQDANPETEERSIDDKSEYLFPFQKFMNRKTYMGRYISDEQDDIFRRQREIILEQAAKGPCVIIGRCADYILAKAGIPAVNVFIHADMEYRKNIYRQRYPEFAEREHERIRNKENLDMLMIQMDKGRTGYYRYYTDWEWGDVNNYDLCLDSSRLGLDLCAKLIIETAKSR